MRRSLAKRLLAFVLAATVTTPVLAQTPVKIGIGFGIGFLPMFIMRDLNLVEKHARAAGLDVKTEYQRISGSAAMQDAVLSGSVDMGAYGVAAMLFAWDKAKGTPQQIFGIAGVNSSPLVLVTNKPDVKTLAELATTDKIAMPALVSPQMYALQMLSEKTFGAGQQDKLKPQVVALPHPESLNAMLSGGTEVKAYFASPPFTQIAIDSGKAHAIASTEDAFGGRSSFLVLGATRRYLDANPKMADVMIGAIAEASDLIRNDPAMAASIYLKSEPSKLLDEARVAAILKANPDDFGVAVYGVKQTADFMVRLKLIKTVPASFKDVFAAPIHQTKSN
ncbi:ABC transporter substrate-binding protein [Bradyrhizobium sp. U87765 SZCCT0131]|uniref:ABC transporter substrate-binding protein n=1 Tax=unclassified Bradyrhizobium TaxID=2631580 RepID=UPI001BA7FADB|nr:MULTISPECIES: ABC transporter substrate-binding protein [unclassified Bradyrhizobium]MBR1221313.1 ABC transporter substrate-binding protein [Bradyrhizobium sp. U87765 SZCCT0131]MBR1264764.1 ABC transporter substrate-binding protein [Bradyrhizobium sp. U87765 SZCCT0134]MBR1304330.1 ABC transporter substrate-binding protein [Bradyrhizobium sp. U87765 SZCCT0110]MBR1322813.1 ABC transporter substrate-binding protein [Bradyrhizobium sp. U87765 SZCCT0109]MBR1346259.1 ABC transporter substrate-bin